MARPATIKDETIIEAAREVFLERGIRATTAEVAERAGVSEGTVFKRFRSKTELFTAAMQSHIAEPAWFATLTERVGKGSVEQALFDVGMEMIAFFRTIMPLMMMSWSNPGPDGLPEPLRMENPPPLRALRALAGFFEAEMRAGRLRRHDPEIVARAFLGGMNSYVFFEVLLKSQVQLPLPAETYVRGLVSALWSGIEPEAAARKGKP
jgi:AcrR family transcriptional regulator